MDLLGAIFKQKDVTKALSWCIYKILLSLCILLIENSHLHDRMLYCQLFSRVHVIKTEKKVKKKDEADKKPEEKALEDKKTEGKKDTKNQKDTKAPNSPKAKKVCADFYR